MDINKFRIDFKAALGVSGKSVFAVAQEFGVQQASLSRFLAGKTGLNAETLLALYPFVYDKPPFPPTPLQDCESQP